MSYLKIILKILFKNNWKSKIIILIVLIVSFMLLYTYALQNCKTDNDYYLPKNIAYIYLNDEKYEEDLESELEKYSINYYQTIPINVDEENIIDIASPYKTELKVDLESIDYIQEATFELLEDNQNKINMGLNVENYGIAYNFNNKIISKYNIVLPNVNYNIANVLVGNYPINDDEVMIGENMANYYANVFNVNTYEKLLNKEISIKTSGCQEEKFCIDGKFKISGIYQMNYPSLDYENFIINPPKNIQELYYKEYEKVPKAYFIEAQNFSSLKPIISRDIYKMEIDYRDFTDYKIYIVLFFLFLLQNLIIFLVFFTTLKNISFILEYYSLSKIKIFLISTIPFIIINGLIIILILFIK